LRILHVLNHTGYLNGNVHAAVDLACAQSRLGYDVAIVSGGGHFDEILAENGVKVFVVHQTRKPLTLAKAVVSFVRLVRSWRADVVHAHMMASAVLVTPACKLARVPLMTTVHNAFEKSAILMGVGTRVIAVSAAVGRSMQKRGIPAARIRVVLNGTIGAARLDRADRTPHQLPSPSVLYVGGLHPRKGISDLLEAFAMVRRDFPAARLTLVGEGPIQDVYDRETAALDCTDCVDFVGPQDPVPYLLGADVFVLPSHFDPAPLVISEAREAGCAIVATDVDGIPELLEGGEAGVLVPARQPARLAAAISKLLGDPLELATWRRNSQRNIEYLSISRVAEDTLRIYRECVRKPAAAPSRVADERRSA
jgi:glycosyltransferase involved in cell wall biosynthesis